MLLIEDGVEYVIPENGELPEMLISKEMVYLCPTCEKYHLTAYGHIAGVIEIIKEEWFGE